MTERSDASGWTKEYPPFVPWTGETPGTAVWSNEYPLYTPWDLERLRATLRVTDYGYLRITEQLNIRVIEYIARPSWTQEYTTYTPWTMSL